MGAEGVLTRPVWAMEQGAECFDPAGKVLVRQSRQTLSHWVCEQIPVTCRMAIGSRDRHFGFHDDRQILPPQGAVHLRPTSPRCDVYRGEYRRRICPWQFRAVPTPSADCPRFGSRVRVPDQDCEGTPLPKGPRSRRVGRTDRCRNQNSLGSNPLSQRRSSALVPLPAPRSPLPQSLLPHPSSHHPRGRPG